MIVVAFDLVEWGRADRLLLTIALPAVPEVGELVRIGGASYRVIDRSWSIDLDDVTPESRTHVRVRVE